MRKVPPKPDWFEIDRYSDTDTLDFRGWATQIGTRIYLSMLLKAGKNDVFDDYFEQLKTAPFFDIDFSASFPSDKAVYPLPFGVAKVITDSLSVANCGDKDFCDENLRELHPGIFDRQAHLYVDLRAPKTLLIKQFGDWLKESLIKRKRGPAITKSVLKTWHRTHPILPYQDLRLWYLRNTGGMLSDGDMSMGLWFGLVDVDGNKIRAIRDWADRAFTIDCYNDLIQSAYESEK